VAGYDFPDSRGSDSSGGRPQPIAPNFEQIVDELKAFNQWVVWRYEFRKGKWTKPPYQPDGASAKTTDCNTWSPFERAREAYERGDWGGIGFVLSEGDPYIAFDFDHCLNAESEIIDQSVAVWLARLNSYTERSPGGEGLRVLVRGKLPPEGRKRGNYECYESARYVTITGRSFPTHENSLRIATRQAEIESIHADIFSEKSHHQVRRPHESNSFDNDAALLDKARAAKNGHKFIALYDSGDWQGAGFSSQSEADMSLCSALAFWTNCDPGRVDSLFRQSALMREKWNPNDYREGTIASAINGCNETYTQSAHTNATRDDAEPVKGTLEWAEHIINDIYEKQIVGPPKDIRKAHELPYIEAAAIFSVEEGARFQRLKDVLKTRGLRGTSMNDWERRVRERERKIKKERDARERVEAREKAQDQKSADGSSTPNWTLLASTHPQPVDGYQLFCNIHDAIRKFVRLEENQATVIALWILFTWVFEVVAETNPFLHVLSPRPQCGKSTLLKVLRYLTRAGWLIASATKSAFIRNAQTRRFTFLLDEADAFLSENEEFRNVLDAASDPDTSNVTLSEKVGDNWVAIIISCFLPIVIASIRKLRGMDTVEGRSIHIHLKRATLAERRTLTKARMRELKSTLEPIANRCARWAQDNMNQLVGKRPVFELDDGRDEDKWEPLIAIADYLDVDVGKQVREIAKQMTGSTADTQESFEVLLLSDIHVLFDRRRDQKLPGDENADKFGSKALCEELAELPERPWASLAFGRDRKAITQSRLAAMLKEFDIKPHEVWISKENVRGFDRKDFEDAWLRYVDAPQGGNEPLTGGCEPNGNLAKNTTTFSENPLFPNLKCQGARPTGRVEESGNFEGARQNPPSTPENGISSHAEKDSSTLAPQSGENGDTDNEIYPDRAENHLTDAQSDEAKIDALFDAIASGDSTRVCPLDGTPCAHAECDLSLHGIGCMRLMKASSAARFAETGDPTEDGSWQSGVSSGGERNIVDGGIPLMITRAMKVELRARGYSDSDIAKLTPAEAHQMLHQPEGARDDEGETPEERAYYDRLAAMDADQRKEPETEDEPQLEAFDDDYDDDSDDHDTSDDDDENEDF
jgi:hypothetical protein